MPTADAATTSEDMPTTIAVTANDVDPDGDPLTVTAATDGANGSTTVNGDSTVTYVPDPDAHGVDSFTYLVSDGTNAASTTVTVTVRAVNDAPSFVAGPDQTIGEDAGPQTVPNWATGISPGPPDEAGQTTTFSVTATVTVTAQAAPVASSTFCLGTSGSGADPYALADAAPPAGDPEPDHDGAGKPGLSINNSGGEAGETDPSKYQHLTRTFGAATTYDGQVRLALWSTVEDFDDADDGHYHVYLHDCAGDGTDCTQLLQSDAHIGGWNDNVGNWVFKDLALGSLDHTFAAGRMLRVRLMFGHNPMWVGLSGSRPTRIILEGP